MNKLRLAIIGQGRSGRNIHGAFYKGCANEYVDVVAVVEKDVLRRERALAEYPGCVVYEDYTELFNRDDLDLVVNDTYSHLHYPITKDLLQHKFNVLVEKPFARSYYECADLIKIAKDNDVVLAVFQQTFLSPFYTKTKEILSTGVLGELLQVNIHYSSFSRRWDWQTLQCMLGGSAYNTGPHPIGLALDFLNFHPEKQVAYSKLSCAQTSGDAEDFAKIILSAPGKPVVDVEISCVDAYNEYLLKIQGTKGTFQCTGNKYKMKYIPDGVNPERPVQREFLVDDNNMPTYCSENLEMITEEGEIKGTGFDVAVARFYEMLYKRIREGVPMEVTPEMAADVINVIETVHGQNPLPVKF